jgi:predicted phage baseplate assembly protein
VESTLQVRVDEVLWHESRSLVDSGATDRHYVTVTDDEQRTKVRFGDGIRGARLPTGIENVSAVYRTGIGPQGNLGPGRISQLATRPLGVKSVTNPVASTGGAGPEGDDVVRRNAPLGVTALDRLVSVQDHADFARTFAGIGKATATRLSDGTRQLVHVTVAGLDDIPIDPASGLFSSLRQAFHRLGDPRLPVELAVRELLMPLLSAQVAVQPDYLWPLVEADVRSALLGRFGFDRRELGQDLLLSEIISTIQQTKGVAYVDVDTFAAVDEPTLLEALKTGTGLTSSSLGLNPRITVWGARVDSGAEESQRLRPAQLTYFDPEQPATIMLTEGAR